MKLMIYLFPIMMLFFLNNFSAGLSLILPAGERDQHPANDRAEELVRGRGEDRNKLLMNMKTPKKKQVAAALGGHAEATADGEA
ncbi:MAG: hypothetical protein IPP83_00115 [Flavobacteriales bacterium]|nr:hypothetical protein [Flavobacteriales bacterium]